MRELSSVAMAYNPTYWASAHVSQQQQTSYGGWPAAPAPPTYGEQRDWQTAPASPPYGEQTDWQRAPASPSYGEQRDWQTAPASPADREQRDWPIGPPSHYFPEEEGGVTEEQCGIRPVSEEERFVYESIGDVLDDVAQEVVEELEQKPGTRCVKCLDYCCQACACSPSAVCGNPFGRRPKEAEGDVPARRVTEIMTPVLRRGRTTGLKLFKNIAFPLVNDIVRDVWIVTELVAILIALGLSAASFSLGSQQNELRIFNSIHLALAAFSTLLAIIDAITNLSQCRSCKQCKQKCCNQNAGTGQRRTRDPESSCRKCANGCSTVSDTVRMLATELLIYPLLVCDMFEFIIAKPWKNPEPVDIIGMLLFVFSLIALVLYVYVIRVVILGYLIKYVHKLRKPRRDDQAYWDKCGYDPSISNSAVKFQAYFFLHIVGQMIGQILTLIAIGAKIQYDNRSCGDVDVDNCTIRISSFLWFMIASGYVLPVCGVLTFFIVTYYWVQEFPVGLCLDILSLLQMPDINTIFYPNETKQSIQKKAVNLAHNLNKPTLKQHFNNIHNKAVSDKVFFPFRSPVLVVLSIIYGAFQFAFILCATLAVDDSGQTITVVLNGGGWVIFYGLSVAFGVVANLYVFAIAAVWVTIIAGIIALIALIIGGLLLCFFMAACVSGDSNSRRTYYR